MEGAPPEKLENEEKPRKKYRWDDAGTEAPPPEQPAQRHWDVGMTPRQEPTPSAVRRSRWDQGPTPLASSTPSRFDQPTPTLARWDTTPSTTTPATHETPLVPGSGGWATPTPLRGTGETPVQSHFAVEGVAASQRADPKAMRLAAELRKRNRHMTDEDIDAALPSEGYEVVAVPADYRPVQMHKQTDIGAPPEPEEERTIQAADGRRYEIPEHLEGALPDLQAEDVQHFEVVIRYNKTADNDIPKEEQKYVLVMRNLLRIKNGDTSQRRIGMKHIIDRAKALGSELLFKHIFELWAAEILDGQQKHFMVKLIERILFVLGDLVTPQVSHILTIIEPLLCDSDLYVREEGKEVIASLARAVGRNAILKQIKSDVAHDNDDVRTLTSRVLAIVCQALGLDEMLSFLRAVCSSQKSWLARHTGTKTVQEVAQIMGYGVVRHLRDLVIIVKGNLRDPMKRVKTQAANAIAALAEAVSPFGVECFNDVVSIIRDESRQEGIRGKDLAPLLKALGYIIPLMEPTDAKAYSADIIDVLIRQFATPDPEVRRVVLKVVQQVVNSHGVPPEFIRTALLKSYFEGFWIRHASVDRKEYRQLIDTTTDIAKKVGCSDVIDYLLPEMNDADPSFQKMVLDCVQKLMEAVGTIDLTQEQVQRLVSATLEAFGNGTSDAVVVVNTLDAVCNGLGQRLQSHVTDIVGRIQFRFKQKESAVRQQAADVTARIAKTIFSCQGFTYLMTLSNMFVSSLSTEKEAPTLAAILKAIRAIIEVVDWTALKCLSVPSLPKELQPIILNPDTLVQENCVQLVGVIAKRLVGKEEGRRQLLEKVSLDLMKLATEGLFRLLNAQRRGTRRATAAAFGDIAVAVNPNTIVTKLLDNLRKDERKERICTENALAVIAERCQPFTVIPFLINEYKLCEGTAAAVTIQRAVLKTLRFIFESLGPQAVDYTYAVIPLLEHALTENDIQQRRMACEVVRNVALAAVGRGYEDAILHLLNFVHPNIVELMTGDNTEKRRMITSVIEVFEACRLALGPGVVLQYTVQGLFHPARVVRDTYWRAYNALYHGAQEALVPFYPNVPDERGLTFSRHELEYLV